MHTAKTTQRNLTDHTKTSNNNYPKSLYSISDINKHYRREQIYKKKLKAFIETNAILENRIKNYQSNIQDQRSTILFQLSELSKTMNSKISTYVDEKLDKDKFSSNQKAHQTIKEMMAKFQDVEKQAKITKRVYHNLKSIFEHYNHYSEEIDKLVKLTEKSNKEYEDGMKNMLNQKQNQIVTKRCSNEDIYDQTQNKIKLIDEYENNKNKLIQEEKQLKVKVQELRALQEKAQIEVDKFKSWAEIVIDKNHRKIFSKQNTQKESQLKKLNEKNNQLEVYLNQLENQELSLKKAQQDKQNLALTKKSKSKRTNKSKGKTVNF